MRRDHTRSFEEGRTRRHITILGSTGSIGTQTLDIVRMHPDRFRISGLTTNGNIELLEEQVREFAPDCVVVAQEERAGELRRALENSDTRVLAGPEALVEAAAWPDVDIVVTAVVGAAGLRPTLAAIREGRRIALANKETMVVAGDLIREAAGSSGSELIPVDSEHSAIFQCLIGEDPGDVEKLLLTASGGPFLDRAPGTFQTISPAEALDHPNWSMGAKITIDSATMMNKGLEVIEARWLFEISPDRIQVVIHPQSIIHSMVTFVDGSSKAQLGPPDMKVPIQFALSYPDRWEAPHDRIDWTNPPTLEFRAPDLERFPCLELAYKALRRGATAQAILNAANEEAVALFLEGSLPFTGIPVLLDKVLSSMDDVAGTSVDDRLEADNLARICAQELAGRIGH